MDEEPDREREGDLHHDGEGRAGVLAEDGGDDEPEDREDDPERDDEDDEKEGADARAEEIARDVADGSALVFE